MIRVLLADDLPVVRSGLRKFLSVAPDIEVVGEAANGQEVLHMVAEVRPNVVLMDVEMPKLDGVAATQLLRQDFPDINVILLTMFDRDRYVFEGLQAGAISYLLKDAENDEIIAAIRAAAQGTSILHPVVATKVVAAYTRLAAALSTPSPLDTRLTRREQEILRHVADGSTNQMIAQRLVVSEGTVRNHLTSILNKLDVNTRGEAVARARELGII
jgi:DNA-binding NarL/FixJ family response regulator